MASIVIADNSLFMMGSLKYLVEHAGHVVLGTGKDGKDTLDLCKRLKPDLVMLDVFLEGNEGHATIKALLRESPGVQIIAVCPPGDEERAQDVRKLGVSGHIFKPFKLTQITEEITRVSKKARM